MESLVHMVNVTAVGFDLPRERPSGEVKILTSGGEKEGKIWNLLEVLCLKGIST